MSPAQGAAQQIDDVYVKLFTRGKPGKVEIGAPDSDPVARIIETINASILRYVGATLRDAELAQLLQPDRVLVRTIPPAGIEALTIWIAPRHVVALNRGLALFVYRLARAFAAHVIDRTPADPPAPPESRTAGIIATLLDWMASPVRAPLVDDWPTGPREIRTAENFATAAERFVLAHEVGHILHKHLIADSAKVDLSQASLPELDRRPVDQEIEADVSGTFISIESMQHEGIDPRAAVTGIYFFFRALQLGELVGAIEVDEAHRPAQERLAICDHVIGERYGSHAPVFRQWAHSTDELLERLAREALAERDRRRTVATARIEEVLSTTTWSTGPRDIVRDTALLKEMQSLMSHSPSAVIEALAASLLDADTYKQLLEGARSAEALEQDDRWRRHQIAHFITRYAPEPVKQALGVHFPIIGGQE
ncbi:hypothetical protein [Bradyrhizobium sp. CCBAU 11361]|uniref:hypothetical protein n=1 Tax=Bradyrhizobium sp. CCBAU 11361 TaxID=1630812 RepID=UPI00230534D5|nr:hypothetical protein [Bradyrhizobium sp. CCBAU 11361]MDA9491395.1 hypothetical protein [Bradyrhizobium sp. CCBAU 11361]